MTPIGWSGTLVALRGHVPAAPLDREVHLDAAAAVQRRDVQVGVQHLDLGRRGDEVRGDLAGPLTAEEDLHGLVAVAAQDELLQVQDDVGDVPP